MKFGVRKLESWGYQIIPDGEEIMTLAFFVLTIPARGEQTDRQTDGRTDRHVAIAITRASIASRG